MQHPQFVLKENNEMNKMNKSKKKIHRCFKSFAWCVGVFLAIIIILAIILVILFPSAPKITFKDPYVPADSIIQINQGNGSLLDVVVDAISGKPFTLLYNVISNFTVESTARIDVGLKQLDLSVWVLDDFGNKFENFVGRGVLKDMDIKRDVKNEFSLV
jgi:hypothetical protein